MAASDASPPVPLAPPRAPTVHVRFVIALVFAVSVLKGARMPSLWAATHMTFDYSAGFVRRGLFGQALRVFGARSYHYQFLAACAALLLLLAATALLLLVRRLLRGRPDDRALQAAVLVLAASPGVVFLVHEIGYLDYLGVIALPSFILYAERTRRFFLLCYVAMAMSVLLALVHESAIVTVVPAVLFTLLCHALARGGGLWHRLRPLMAIHLGLVTTVALIASVVAGTLGRPTPARIEAMQATVGRYANFALRTDAFAAIRHSLRDNLLVVLPGHWSDPINRRYLITGLVVALPGLAFLAGYGVRMIRRLPVAKPARALLTITLLTASLSPLLLNFIGWDSARWNALAFMTTFFCVASLRLLFAGHAEPAPGRRLDGPTTLTLAAALVVLGLCTNYYGFLFDGHQVQWFPFDRQLDSAIEVWKGRFRYLPGS